jgi:hypothetical protein
MLWGADFAEETAIHGHLNPTQDITADATLGFIGRPGLDIKGKLRVKVTVFFPQF